MPGRSFVEILSRFETPPRRLVSLVPSYTESLFALGMGKSIVGVTDYCPIDLDINSAAVQVGGPRNARIEDILALQPDLVLANYEENTRPVVEALETFGVPVWVSFPCSVNETLEFLWCLVDLFRSQTASMQVRMIASEVDWVRQVSNDTPQVKYFCPIWQGQTPEGKNWWMTFNEATYSSSLLELMGGVNIFAQRQRRYPLAADIGNQSPEEVDERDTRYPCVTAEEIIAAQPEIIFLPDEPYLFGESDEQALSSIFAKTPAGESAKIIRIDGRLISWYGTRMALALAELPQYFPTGYDKS